MLSRLEENDDYSILLILTLHNSEVAISGIAVQVSGKERSGGGELLANQPQPNQPRPHGEFRVFRLLWFRTGGSQSLCHFGKGKAKLYVAFQLSGMKSVFPAVGRLVELK